MTDLAAQANHAQAAKVAIPLLEAYWAKHDPTGERRARLTKEGRVETMRSLAARLDEEWRASMPKPEAEEVSA